MTLLQRAKRTLRPRILVWGPIGAGKTEFVSALRRVVSRAGDAPVFRVADESGRTLSFDMLGLPEVPLGDFRVRARVLAAGGSPDGADHRRALASTADAVIFLADARADAVSANRDSLQELREALSAANRADVPLVLACNRVDEPGSVPAADLGETLATDAPLMPTIATEAAGVHEVLEAVFARLIETTASGLGLEPGDAATAVALLPAHPAGAAADDGAGFLEVRVRRSAGAPDLEAQIQLADLCDEMAGRHRLLEDRNRELMAINRVARSILSALEAENLIVILLDSVAEHLHTSHAACVLFEGAERGALRTHVQGFGRDPALRLKGAAARSFFDLVAASDGPIPVDSTRNGALLAQLQEVDRRIRTAVFQAIRQGDQLGGWLAVYDLDEQGLPGTQDLLFLSSIARMASLGLHKIRLYEDAKRRCAELEQEVRDRIGKLEMAEARIRALNRGMEARVGERTRELEAKNRALRERQANAVRSAGLRSMVHLAASFAHEVNNPVAGLRGNLDLMRESLDELRARVAAAGSDASEGLRAIVEFEEILDESVQSARRVSDVIASLKRFGGEDDAQRAFSLNAAIADAVTLLEERLEACAELDLRLGNVAPISGNALELSHMVLALLTNAVESLERAGRRGQIAVTTYSAGDRITLTLRDTGTGIPEKLLPRVFEPFVSSKEGEPNAGLGLHTAYRTVREHEGTIKIKSKPGEGTLVTVTLPRKEPEA